MSTTYFSVRTPPGQKPVFDKHHGDPLAPPPPSSAPDIRILKEEDLEHIKKKAPGQIDVKKATDQRTRPLPILLRHLSAGHIPALHVGQYSNVTKFGGTCRTWREMLENPPAGLPRPVPLLLVTVSSDFFEALDRAAHGWARELPRPIIGESPAITAALDAVERFAKLAEPVLILGETGTGKELFARALHFQGPRKDQPFVAYNCAATPKELLESELFGSLKSAYTNAIDRTGLFRAADRGSLFLDEIGETPLDLQPKLLRALQEHVVRPLGSDDPFPIDVRFIAATNKDLAQEIRARTFRSDLYYRLATHVLRVPALREHKEDIPALVAHFLAIQGRNHQREFTVTDDVLECFMKYPWPGNVRELESAIASLVASVGRDGVLNIQVIRKHPELSSTFSWVAPRSVPVPQVTPNPYASGSLLFGRTALLEGLLADLGKYRWRILVGGRQSGKSAILSTFRDLLAGSPDEFEELWGHVSGDSGDGGTMPGVLLGRYVPVLVSCAALPRKDDITDIEAEILRASLEAIQEGSGRLPGGELPEDSSGGSRQAFLELLDLLGRHDRVLVLLLDDIEKLAGQSWFDDFAGWLNFLHGNHRTSLWVLLTGTERLQSYVQQRGSPLQAIAPISYIHDLDYRARRRMATEPFLSADRPVPPPEIQREIDQLAAGHPWLLSLFYEALFEKSELSPGKFAASVLESYEPMFARWARALDTEAEAWKLYERIVREGEVGAALASRPEKLAAHLLRYYGLVHPTSRDTLELGPVLFARWARTAGFLEAEIAPRPQPDPEGGELPPGHEPVA